MRVYFIDGVEYEVRQMGNTFELFPICAGVLDKLCWLFTEVKCDKPFNVKIYHHNEKFNKAFREGNKDFIEKELKKRSMYKG